jgi:hypothetical protein
MSGFRTDRFEDFYEVGEDIGRYKTNEVPAPLRSFDRNPWHWSCNVHKRIQCIVYNVSIACIPFISQDFSLVSFFRNEMYIFALV